MNLPRARRSRESEEAAAWQRCRREALSPPRTPLKRRRSRRVQGSSGRGGRGGCATDLRAMFVAHSAGNRPRPQSSLHSFKNISKWNAPRLLRDFARSVADTRGDIEILLRVWAPLAGDSETKLEIREKRCHVLRQKNELPLRAPPIY
jgi:hypothetical protein